MNRIKAAALAALAPAAVAGVLALAPQAGAQWYGGGMMLCNHPVNSGGAMVFGAGGYFCDEAATAGGQHFHCEWGGFIGYGGSCTWRWADNTIAPPP
jgi:hypothetical protein